MNIEGAAVLVTGGGRGLGRAFAIEAARRGARVVVVARNKDEIGATVATIRAFGGVAYAIAADVADKERTYAVAGEASALVGPIDVIVHAAGSLGPVPLQNVLDTSCEDFEHALAVNAVGPFRLTKAIASSMMARKHGVVVAISSDAAVDAYPMWGAYGASKATFDRLIAVLAVELEGSGVACIVVDPGEMDTAMHAAALPDVDRSTLGRPEAVAARLVVAVESATNGRRVIVANGGAL